MQAAVVAQTASKSIADLQNTAEDSDSLKDEEGAEGSANEKESDDENEKLRKSALNKLEKASEDSMLSQVRHKRIIRVILYARPLIHSTLEQLQIFAQIWAIVKVPLSTFKVYVIM